MTAEDGAGALPPPIEPAITSEQRAQRDTTLKEARKGGLKLADLNKEAGGVVIKGNKDQLSKFVSYQELRGMFVDQKTEALIEARIRREPGKKGNEATPPASKEDVSRQAEAMSTEMNAQVQALKDATDKRVAKVFGSERILRERKARYLRTATEIVDKKIAASERGVLGAATREIYKKALQDTTASLAGKPGLEQLQGTPKEQLKQLLDSDLISAAQKADLRYRLAEPLYNFPGNSYVEKFNSSRGQEWLASPSQEYAPLTPLEKKEAQARQYDAQREAAVQKRSYVRTQLLDVQQGLRAQPQDRELQAKAAVLTRLEGEYLAQVDDALRDYNTLTREINSSPEVERPRQPGLAGRIEKATSEYTKAVVDRAVWDKVITSERQVTEGLSQKRSERNTSARREEPHAAATKVREVQRTVTTTQWKVDDANRSLEGTRSRIGNIQEDIARYQARIAEIDGSIKGKMGLRRNEKSMNETLLKESQGIMATYRQQEAEQQRALDEANQQAAAARQAYEAAEQAVRDIQERQLQEDYEHEIRTKAQELAMNALTDRRAVELRHQSEARNNLVRLSQQADTDNLRLPSGHAYPNPLNRNEFYAHVARAAEELGLAA